MTQWNNRDFYFASVDQLAAGGCYVIGLDINQNQLEYPLEALLLQKNPSARFVHVNVTNASARYERIGDPIPCAVLRLR